MSVTYRWAVAGDAAGIAGLLRDGFGPGSLQCVPGRFEWLCLDHPEGFHATLAESGGRIVAFRGCLPFACERPAGIRAAFGMDFLVLPEYRRQGIGRALLHMALERFDLAVTTAPSPTNERLYRSMGAREIAAVYSGICRCVRPVGVGRARTFVRDWASFVYHRCVAAPRGRLRPIGLERVCELVGDAGSRLSAVELGTPRDAAFLRWRYGRGPYARDYLFFEVALDGGPPAAVVVRPTATGVALVDLVCRPESRSTALARLAAGGLADAASALFAGEPLRRAFRRAGFIARRTWGRVLALSLHASLLAEVDRFRWVSFPADSDMDLVRMPAPAVVKS